MLKDRIKNNKAQKNEAFSSKQLQQLCDTAKKAAITAGHYIASVDRSNIATDHKTSGTSLASKIVTDVDRHCEQLIRNALAASCKQFQLALLSEETSDAHLSEHHTRFSQPYFWCIDPLDGTLPFTQGETGYAVSIALITQSGKPLIGAVYDPVNDDLFHAIDGQGAYKNNQHIEIPDANSTCDQVLLVYADHSFQNESHHSDTQRVLRRIADQVGCNGFTEIYGNGAVKNACGILHNPLACYFKRPKITEGGGSLWDFGATACIIKEAGGWVSDWQGNALDLNRTDSTFMNHRGILYASNAEIAQSIMQFLK